jgi:DNA-binding LacI/PurR family transcriptional regulator
MSATLLPAKAASARDQILALIKKGVVRPGQRLPSERELAAQLGMDHRTIRRGLADLTAAGLVVKRARLGNFVHPNPAEPSTAHVAVILPRWLTGQAQRHPMIGTIWNGITSVFDQRSGMAQIHLLDYHHKSNLWLDAGQIAASRGVKGAIVFSHPQLTCDQVQPMLDEGIKIVTVMDQGRGLDRLRIPLVNIGVESVLRQALHRLAELGHRRIVMVGYRDDDPRESATVQALFAEAGLEFDSQTLVQPPNPKPRLDTTLIRDALLRTPRPTAMLVLDEVLAAGVFRCCYELGLRVPQDLSLASVYDHTPHAYPVHLSAVDTESLISRMAEKAAGLLQRMMAGERVDEQIVTIGGEVQWQESVAAVPAG